MPADQDNESIAELELKLLRAVILKSRAASWESTDEVTTLDELARYKWTDEEHRVVYECLCAFARRNGNLTLREEMAAETTRKGHPDVDWDSYFESPSDASDPSSLIRSLKISSRK